ncbi:class I SAM-dependent methyltransferase [Plantactinospora sp. WMMC1484]|uniref:class I SAM-dependent methyltransferase n=1 Tax=Plantactinospora sp. WMMC1484 TaxID=3404122 RepID=UPI003BF59D13
MTAATDLSRCLVCGGAADRHTRLDGNLRHCPSCTFTWTAHHLPPTTELYDESYFTGDGYEDYYLPRPRRYESTRRLRWLLRTTRNHPPRTLIEAGSAGGYFIEAARHAGITAHGIEISEHAARHAREHLHVPVQHGHFETTTPAHPVDAVCAFHVLEHVDNPRHFLHAAHHMLNPQGWLALEVPNIASAAATRLGTDWPGLQLRYHRWHFTPESLIRLVTTTGYDVITCDTAVFRYYMPVGYRLRHARRLVPPDWSGTRSLRLTQPRLGDLLRLVARTRGGTRRERS